MRFKPTTIDFHENNSIGWATVGELVRLGPGARLIGVTVTGPLVINRATFIGPEVTTGRYVALNENCSLSRGSIGSFCTVGSRTSINPFTHPINWLSIHEFQYNRAAFDWVLEWNEVDKVERAPTMFHRVSIGNDVWMGNSVTVLAGADVGDGAIIGAGAVVTKSVPPYAIVAGSPARVLRYRFDEATIARLLAVRWWDFELAQLKGMDFRDVGACLEMLEAMRAELG